MTGLIGHRGLMMHQGAPPTDALYDLIIADSPIYYFRHAESSGLVMENEVGSDGAYTASSITLGSSALYPSGPTSVRIPSVGGSGLGLKSGGTAPAMNELTIFGIVKFDSSLSGQKGLISYDNGGSLRKWQLRTNGTTIEYVKIQGGVDVKSYSAGFVNGNTYVVCITIDSSGNFKFNINGSNVSTSSIATTNYGGSSEYIEVGYCTGAGGIYANSFFSESAIFNTAISDARLAQYWNATGL